MSRVNFVVLALSNDIDTSDVALSMSVLSGLRGFAVNNFAWVSLER